MAVDHSWRATLDGAPAEILRANVAFRAVRAPAGRHLIEMTCRPRLLMLGAGISAIAGAGALLSPGSAAGGSGRFREPLAARHPPSPDRETGCDRRRAPGRARGRS